MKKQFYIGIFISILFIYLISRRIDDFHQTYRVFLGAEYIYIIISIIALMVTFWLRAMRWKYLFAPIKQVSTHSLFSAIMIGYMGNNILPLRLGEVLRAYAIGRSERVSVSASVATIIIERILDIITLLVILSIVLFIFPFDKDWLKNSGYLIFIITISFSFFLFIFSRYTNRTLRVINQIIRLTPSSNFQEQLITKSNRILKSFKEGLVFIRQTHHYGIIFILSLIMWFLYGSITLLTLYAFNFISNYNLSPVITSLVMLVILTIGIMIPSAPGYIGTFHGICVAGLALFGIPESEALGFALVLHASQFIPITLVGFYFFWIQNLHFSDAMQKK